MTVIIILAVLGSIALCILGIYILLQAISNKNPWVGVGGGLLFVITIACLWSSLIEVTTESRRYGYDENEELEASWGTKQLNIDNLYEELLTQSIDYPEIVLAQALLETGHFTSYSCRERNNLFGLMKSDGTAMSFPHWTYSVAAYKKYIQKYSETPDDYYKYLDRLGYASDSTYILKVKEMKKKHVDK